MRVCVVGGTGNISTSIVKLLADVGHEVTVFNRGRSPGLPAGVAVLRGDRADRPAFEAAVQAGRFDAGIDMLCFTAEDARSTVRAFRGVRHLVCCSTVCTYGVTSDWLPVTEDHPLRPITDYGRGKVEADRVFLEAFCREGFPVTIIKPSTTFGPRWNLLRQIAWDAAWVDRVRKGKPIAVCGDGRALHQWLYVDDAAPAFVFALGRERCVGQTYNMTKTECGTWADYHRVAMKVMGREVELVGVPLATLLAARVPNVGICETIFSHNTCYSPARLMRDVPEFRPRVSLEEGLGLLYEAMQREGRIPDSDAQDWEDRLIAAQRRVGELRLS
jgi:nucleoside-diphosphate-sugar epimerase